MKPPPHLAETAQARRRPEAPFVGGDNSSSRRGGGGETVGFAHGLFPLKTAPAMAGPGGVAFDLCGPGFGLITRSHAAVSSGRPRVLAVACGEHAGGTGAARYSRFRRRFGDTSGL